MAIQTSTLTVINADGKLQNSPSLTVSHPTSSNTVITVSKQKLETFGGEILGFTSGGHPHPSAPSSSSLNQIQKFPFAIASGGTATDIGDLSARTYSLSGHSSASHGYSTGGAATGVITDNIEKFPFTQTSVTASVVGDLSDELLDHSAHHTASHGFTSGGQTATLYTSPVTTVIQKFPFSIDGGYAVDVGNLITARDDAGGHSSDVHGYVSGGAKAPPTPLAINSIERFPFAITSGSAADVGDINPAPYGLSMHAAMSSETQGFVASGGQYGTSPSGSVKSFPFASSTSVTGTASYSPNSFFDVVGISSTTQGYFVGGLPTSSGSPGLTDIRKFNFTIPFSVQTDVGDLATAGFSMAGHQY